MIIPYSSRAGWGTNIIYEARDRRQWGCVGGIEDAKCKMRPINLDCKVMPVIGGERRLKQKGKRMVANFQGCSIGDRYDAGGDGER